MALLGRGEMKSKSDSGNPKGGIQARAKILIGEQREAL
jgi:hypothetical protein